MVSSKAKTVDLYLSELPDEQRRDIETLRKEIKRALPKGFEEGMIYGMIGYYIPLSHYPNTYNGEPLGIAALASQKRYNSLYLMSIYGDKKLREWLEGAYRKAGRKLDMGKSCLRFKRVEELPLEVIRAAISKLSVDELIAHYEGTRPAPKVKAKAKAKKAPAKAKKAPAKKKKKSAKKKAPRS